MTTFATDQQAPRLDELARRERRAWADYRECLRDLAGREYVDAERDCWAQLQAQLRAIAGEREGLAGDGEEAAGMEPDVPQSD